MIHDLIQNNSQKDVTQFRATDFQISIYPEDKVINMWLLTMHSQNTRDAYLRDIFYFLFFCAKKIDEIKIEDIQNYMLNISNLKNTSQRRKLACIKSLFSFCLELGLLKHNPTKVIKLKKCTDCISDKLLTERQIKKIIESEYNLRNKLLLKMLYITGARVSEICNIKWNNFRVDDEYIYLSIIGKGEKHNTIIIPNHIWLELQVLKTSDNEFVFTNKKSHAISRTQIFRIVQNAAKRAGIDKPVSPHCFRHSMATTALRRGASLKLIQQQLNHSSIATTGLYLHTSPTESASKYLKI